MVPDADVRNLIAPVPCSASHIGFSTLRMEPCWMALGHAAGIAACMTLEDGVDIPDVNVRKLQERLLDEGGVLCHDPGCKEPLSSTAWKKAQLDML